ncbi:serine/threonine protein phosphatase, partial [Streptomyces tunisiensis]
MDSTRVTEQPTSFERPQPGVDPADPRGAFLRSPAPAAGTGAALPAQGRSGGEPPAPGAAAPGGPAPDAADGPASEHSQPGAGPDAEPDAHRPRPAPDGIPVQ